MTVENDDAIYYWIGKTALDSIHAVLDILPDPPVAERILDFPSGYGRVLRFLRYAWPTAEITACDIEKAAVKFCAKTFDAVPVYSSMDVKRVRLDGKYDLIWVGSLFTHLTEESASDLLSLFYASLAQGGVLIFTIAGEFVYDLAMSGDHRGLAEESIGTIKSDFEQAGFAYGSYLPGIVTESNIGRAFIHRDWLNRKIADYPAMREVAYINRGYARRQDVVAWRMS
jgi:SAM-dependent methyltransferase